MNCPNCRAPLMIEDKFCRYCGTENPYFTQHREDMKEFTEEFRETKQEVLSKTKHTIRINANISIICVLITLNLLVFLGMANTWGISSAYNNWRTNKNEATVRATLEEYSDAGDINGFYHYYQNNVHGYNNNLDDYDAVNRVVTQYSYIYDNILDITVCYEEDGYCDISERSIYVSDSLVYFYKYLEQDEYDDPAEFTEEHLATMHLAQEQLELLLEGYLNIAPEDIPALLELSSARRALIIEEGALLYVE